jgi:lipoprotein-anchoring transpeptidase ErfK/SrfK
MRADGGLRIRNQEGVRRMKLAGWHRVAGAAIGLALATSFAVSTPAIAPAAADRGAQAATFSTSASDSVPPTVTAPPPVPLDTRPKAPSFVTKTGKAIYLDRRRQRIYVYLNGRQIDTFLCATSSTLPRRGKYRIYRKRPQSMSFNGAVTFRYQSIFTVGPHGNNIAFHSIPVNRAGHEIAPLGRPVSHGCVRVKLAKAKFIYYWATRTTPIYVRP